IADTIREQVREIDFYRTVMEGMLGLLLFAGALDVDIEDLKANKGAIAVMASIGVVISTLIVGFGFSWIAGVPIAVALVFGALISPTDPVAVLGILKTVKVPISLKTKIAGESLFNDGVGVVLFLILAAVAFPETNGGEPMGVGAASKLFLMEAVGGAVLGGVAGWLAYIAIRQVDEYTLEVTITLALAMGAYALAGALHLSGPIAVVVAGLFIGNHGTSFGMSEKTQEHVRTFWHLIDEILNAVLFLLIGVEVVALDLGVGLTTALLAIPLVLFARFISVGTTVTGLRIFRDFTPGAVPVMTWGGLRGGISVALVLSLPEGEWRPVLFAATCAVVVFSILVQGLTVRRAIKRFVG
ncbi:MAG: sodium:proton antiporter, partial [Rhodospirillaceae bacterium]|nr:sodium:proton antiporter [Rhodospirillaceae bacterium]